MILSNITKWFWKMKKITKSFEFIDIHLFNKLFILHPDYAVNGKISNDIKTFLSMSRTKVVVSVDRNVLSRLLSAVKRGAFQGDDRKEITAFLVWLAKSNYGLSPYDALKEQAFVKQNNISGNKENDLFNYLFSDISMDTIIKSFFYEGISFPAKNYDEALENLGLDFQEETPDYLFLYATMLHFVYILRTIKNRNEQFESLIRWYFKECLISVYALTYMVTYYTRKGITPPHNYTDNEKAILGCKNEAMDLLYIQSLDTTRYPSDKYTFMLATCDIVLKEVFETVNDVSKYRDLNSYFNLLCSDMSEQKRKRYVQILEEAYTEHKYIGVNPENAYEIAKKLVDKEEQQLKDILMK